MWEQAASGRPQGSGGQQQQQQQGGRNYNDYYGNRNQYGGGAGGGAGGAGGNPGGNYNSNRYEGQGGNAYGGSSGGNYGGNSGGYNSNYGGNSGGGVYSSGPSAGNRNYGGAAGGSAGRPAGNSGPGQSNSGRQIPYVDSYRAPAAGRLTPERVAQMINQFDAQIRDLRSQNEKIGTRFDTPSFRSQLSSLRDKANQTAMEIGKFFTDNQNMMRDAQVKKLHRDFTRVFENYKNVQQESLNLERENITRMSVYRQQSLNNSNSFLEQQEQDRIFANAKITHADFDDLAEREQEYEILGRNMQQVQNLFLQLNELAEVQGEQVDAITENVEAANTDVHRGVQELEEAVTKSKKASKRNLYILLATIIVLLVVAIPLIIKYAL